MNRNRLRSTLVILAVAALMSDTAIAQAPERGRSANKERTAEQPPAQPLPPAIKQAFGVPSERATYDPSTRAAPGVVTGARKQSTDAVHRASGHGSNDTVGHTIYDTDFYQMDVGLAPTTPEFHTVQSGDTLWAICTEYFRDPYLWPKVWSYNQQITNAHWIFPGDRVRLRNRDEPQQGALEEEAPRLSYIESYKPKKTRPGSYLISRYAFVERDEFEHAMEVKGGDQAKVMMSTLDTAYVSYSSKNPPVAGERLAVYKSARPVYEWRYVRRNKLKRGKKIGYIVEVTGEVYVESIAKKTAEAKIVDALQPIERGMKVGELQTRFQRIEPVPSESSESGLVIDSIREQRLIGDQVFAVVNMGSLRGVRRGNLLEVVRKGDEYSEINRMSSPYEQGHPRRIVGELLVVQVQEETSLAFVLNSRREIIQGDHVEMRANGNQAQQVSSYQPNAELGPNQ